MRRVVAVLLGVSLTSLGGASDADAQVHGPGTKIPQMQVSRVDARFAGIRAVLESHGPASTYFGPEGLGDVRTDGTAAMLRFDGVLPLAELDGLRRAGVEFQVGRAGQPLRVGPVYGAFVRWEALPVLETHPRLVYAEASWHPKLEQPLEVTGGEIGSLASVRMPDVGFDGTGTVIGDIDSGIDVLHPHFFFADGGAFAWLDGDGNGRFDAGLDAVDYNADGAADRNELLHVLDGAATNLYTTETVNDDDVLDPRFDWLYADRNGDGERNVGPDAGFTEFDPGYGEPLFIVDDADRDGVLDPEEKLILLSTSKIQRYVTTARTWVRGTDLIEAAHVPNLDYAMHGTGVASILVGGQPRAHDRVGIAPAAELVMYASHLDAEQNGFEEVGQLRDLEDAVQSGLDVVIHEWTNPYTAPHDGSGNFEAAMDAARDAGVAQVNPLGNLNLSQKHLELPTAAGANARLSFEVDPGFQWGQTVYPYTVVYMSIFWRGEHVPRFEIASPGGATAVLPMGDATPFSVGADAVQAIYNRSSRGTHHLIVTVWNPDNQTSIATGEWGINITNTAVADTFVARVADYYSAWSVGVHWITPTQGNGTVVYPATADAAIGVAAYAGRHEQPWEGSSPGQLRGFSGRGPRIDGAPVVDIAAPDDPFAALVGSPQYLDAGYGRSWFTVFGGTSGAGPHVAGTVALLRSQNPDISVAAIEEQLTGTARRDAFTPAGAALPNHEWGYGKLDTWAAVRGSLAPPQNPAPTVATVTRTSGGLAADASDSDGDALSYRWDFDYDGTWDTPWQGEPTVEVALEEDAHVRLEVADARGNRAGFVYIVEPTTEIADDDGEADAGGDEPPPVNVVPMPETRDCYGCAGNQDAGAVIFLLPLAFRRRRRRRSP